MPSNVHAKKRNTKMINIALVGCGRIAKRHSDLLGTSQIPGARLAAVCDSVAARAEATGSKHGMPWYEDMDVMMREQAENIDVVTVLTPSGLHAEHVLRLAKYKKHIIVEKPMALNIDDADDMIRACYLQGVKLFVVKQNRLNVPVQRLRMAVESGRFGKLVLGTVRVRWCRRQDYYDQDAWRGTWAYDGGVLANQASHHVDLLQWMIGDVQSVFAKSSAALVHTETEDTAIATVQFKNGALGVIEATTATRPRDLEGSISILGENGAVEIGGFAVNSIKTWQFANELPEDKEVIQKYSVNPPNVYGFGHQAYYEHVVDCLTNGTTPLVDGIEGRKSVELISALYESIETSREIQLRFHPQHCRLGLHNHASISHL
jgi:predicted dehydrogenase